MSAEIKTKYDSSGRLSLKQIFARLKDGKEGVGLQPQRSGTKWLVASERVSTNPNHKPTMIEPGEHLAVPDRTTAITASGG